MLQKSLLWLSLSFQSWPNYEVIFKKIIEVATFLDLPRFPDITENCYLHPNILCMKYLMEVNLPGKCEVYMVSKPWLSYWIIMKNVSNPLNQRLLESPDKAHSNMKLNFKILS